MKKLQFADTYWNDVYLKLLEVARADALIIGPSEFSDGFPLYYIYEYKELCDNADFVLVHKGRVEELGSSFHEFVTSSMKPVFANEVFVLFGREHVDDRLWKHHVTSFTQTLEKARVTPAQPAAETLTDLLNLGEYAKLRGKIELLTSSQVEHFAELADISFKVSDWPRLYAISYAPTANVNFETLLYHRYASLHLQINDRLNDEFLRRIQSYVPSYDTITLRLFDLTTLDVECSKACKKNQGLVSFFEKHFVSTDFGTVTAHASPANDPIEPIDAVYTWFSPDDQNWLRKKAKCTPTGDIELDGSARYGNIGEIYYSIDLLIRNMPFLRYIFIVHDEQRQFFDDSRLSCEARKRLRFVDHKEYLRKEVLLPSFNSDAIESCLHLIPELSETFIYCNDDCFLAKPLKKSDLYVSDGRPRLIANAKSWKKEDLRIRGSSSANRDAWTLRVFKEKFGSVPGFVHAHQLMICQRRAFERMWEVFSPELESRIVRHQMRTHDSLSFVKLMHWLSDYEQRQVPTILSPSAEVYRRGIDEETVASTQLHDIYFYSLNNMNESCEELLKLFYSRLADSMQRGEGIGPLWAINRLSQ